MKLNYWSPSNARIMKNDSILQSDSNLALFINFPAKSSCIRYIRGSDRVPGIVFIFMESRMMIIKLFGYAL